MEKGRSGWMKDDEGFHLFLKCHAELQNLFKCCLDEWLERTTTLFLSVPAEVMGSNRRSRPRENCRVEQDLNTLQKELLQGLPKIYIPGFFPMSIRMLLGYHWNGLPKLPFRQLQHVAAGCTGLYTHQWPPEGPPSPRDPKDPSSR